MVKNNGLRIVFVLAIALLWSAVSIIAADDSAGRLTVGVPVSAEITAEGETIRFDYTPDQPVTITLQAFSENAQPTLTVWREGEVIAADANDSGGLVIAFDALLTGGDYVVEVGATGGTTGLIIVLLQSETPISMIDLPFAVTAHDTVSAGNPVIIYRFTAMAERTFVDVERDAEDRGVAVRLFNETDDSESGTLSADLLGGRFYIAANGADYRLEIAQSDADTEQAFRVCWSSAAIGGCDDAVIAPVDTACTVVPSASAVNIRASASVESSIVGALTVDQFAPVIGIDPEGTFYNIELGAVNGWVATSVVIASGDCADVAVIVPPAFAPASVATAPPVSTSPPDVPAPLPTQTPSGPCRLVVNSPVFVYLVPVAIVDDLFDQVQMGELFPTGRLADNSWWQTSYGNSWIETSHFGNTVTVSGDCSGLPVVAAP